ncbi:hypothetical protein PAAG_00078 [Paracoccidioides lutzii Pb01]|uniref:Uncharacterized protein n=1 Tax=Paracoccidioides lutzii (strain ATCC MYA-826 / Pb01) TaxID=502779 RepID=C1GNI3_PARBA|nr:hypothetical protein PAAG_00078 [Paracoccidioides lutzii Pb01]EEH35755.1 hypothetical protein PAAG_00078 [Paracoccidioides lutzii Pb01]
MLHSSPPGMTLRNDCCRHPPNRPPPPSSVFTPHQPEPAPDPAPAPAPAPAPHPHPPSTATQIYTPANPNGNGPSHLLSAYLAPSQSTMDARSGPGSRTTLPLTIPRLPSMAGHSNPYLQRNRNGRSAVYEEDVDVADENDVDAGVAATDGENAFFILLRLSFVVPPFSLFAALYTLFTLLFLLLTSPLRLCPPNRGPFFKHPLSTQISSLLLPLLHSHQRLIDPHRKPPLHPHLHNDGRRYKKKHRHDIDYRQKPATTTDMHHAPCPSASIPCFSPPPPTPAPPHPHPHPHPPQQQQQPQPSTHSHSHFPTLLVLILIHLLSPFLLAPLLLAMWIASFFWVFAMIVGNPDGTERRDDGRVAVLGVRNWWAGWLGRGRRRERGDEGFDF